MKVYISSFLLVAIFSLCAAQDCNNLSHTFANYESAVNAVRQSTFEISDECDTSKSSWIVTAQYYSCDGQEGFFILSTSRNEYIHQNMPIEVWNSFKTAESFGRYYNAYIKGKYPLILK